MSSLNKKITANKTKNFVNDNDLRYYRGKQYFDEGSSKQNYLAFLPMGKYFKLNSNVGVMIVCYHGNPNEFLMKVLSHLQHLIIASIKD